MAVEVDTYKGGMKWMAGAGLVGVLGVAITVAGFLGDAKKDAYHSWLFAFTFWMGVALGGLILNMAFHAAGAKWPTVFRRPMEAISGALPALLVLFIPVLVGLPHIFRWVTPETSFTPLEQHHFHGHKAIYLDSTFFYVRQALYWVVFLAFSLPLGRWSKQVDAGDGFNALKKTRRLSGAGIPIVGLAATFAGFDWLMTLTPFWYSTIFGAYYLAGGFLCAIAFVTLTTVWTAKDRNLWGFWTTPHHHHNLGKLLLAFVSFWAYIGFSQLLLVWIANIPEEVAYYWVRLKTPWVWVSAILIFGHFALPFVALLSRTVKLIPWYMAAMSIWIVLMGVVDVYWMVMPALYPEAPVISLYNVTAFLGVGGISVAAALFSVRGRVMLPVKDPYLEDSLRYAQP